MKKIKFFLKIFEWLIFAVILIIFFIIASPILPTKNYFVSYIVTSGSMEPAIKTGSVAITRSAQNFQEKDIIAFSSPSDPKQTVLHRIISIDKDKIKTKGDANNGADIWTIPPSSVKGVLAFSIPFIGYPAAFLKTPKGFFLIVIIPAILLIILQFKKIKEGINEEIIKRVGAHHDAPEKIILIALFTSAVLTFTKPNFISALFTSTVNVQGVSVSVKDFVPPPAPKLTSPADGITRTTTGLVMDWDDVHDYQNMHDPVYYIYQSARNSDFSPAAYTSGHLTNSNIPAPGTPNGKYWWHVMACDTLNNCSNWSDPWTVTINNNPSPTPSITPTPTTIPSLTPTPTPSPTETPTPTITPSPTASPEITPSPTISPTSTPT